MSTPNVAPVKLSVVAAAREERERPPDEPIRVASVADRLGYGEVWIGEGPTWDGFALATAVGLSSDHVSITVGPVPISVRDPATIVRAAATVATLTGRVTGVALGTSSARVVQALHGRSRRGASRVLGTSAETVRHLMAPATPGESGEPAPGFRRRLSPPGGPLTVAAFGDRAIAVAAAHADRMLLDLVTPDQVAESKAKLEAAAQVAGRHPPALAAWLPAAVDPDERSSNQLLDSIVGYLTVRGYAEVFRAAGFDEAVRRAEEGAEAAELVSLLPPEAAATVGLVGSADTVRGRLEAYASAGLDEVAVVPATAGDASGERTLTALAGL